MSSSGSICLDLRSAARESTWRAAQSTFSDELAQGDLAVVEDDLAVRRDEPDEGVDRRSRADAADRPRAWPSGSRRTRRRPPPRAAARTARHPRARRGRDATRPRTRGRSDACSSPSSRRTRFESPTQLSNPRGVDQLDVPVECVLQPLPLARGQAGAAFERVHARHLERPRAARGSSRSRAPRRSRSPASEPCGLRSGCRTVSRLSM